MTQILLATSRPDLLHSFRETLASVSGVQIQVVDSGTGALQAVRLSPPHLVVIDGGLPDFEPFDLVRELLMVNAMVHTAVVSPLPEDSFHEASEGLGILSRLRPDSGKQEAIDLLERLSRLEGLSSEAPPP